jgi:hypothetical protein
VDVLEPLVALKVGLCAQNSLSCGFTSYQGTQERIRKRIKDDLKESITAHNEYAEVTLPKLKRAYLKKCQEAEVI